MTTTIGIFVIFSGFLLIYTIDKYQIAPLRKRIERLEQLIESQ